MITRSGMVKAVLWFFTIILILLSFWGENFANLIIFQHWNTNHKVNNHGFIFEKEEFYIGVGEDSVHVIFNKVPRPLGTIIYFHGNAGILKRWNPIASEFCNLNYNVLVWDYKGYGLSSGKTNLENFCKQGKALFDQIINFDSTSNIILYGRSLGTGIVADLANELNVSKIILETPYTSMKSLIAYKTWIGQYFVKHDIPSLSKAEKLKKPVLIIHGTHDQLIPYTMAENYFHALQSEQKRMLSISGGTHDNLSEYPAYWETLEDFLMNE